MTAVVLDKTKNIKSLIKFTTDTSPEQQWFSHSSFLQQMVTVTRAEIVIKVQQAEMEENKNKTSLKQYSTETQTQNLV